jgi:hypothetical protein
VTTLREALRKTFPDSPLSKCRKLPYQTFEDALAAIESLRASGQKIREPEALRPYRCDDCGLFHNGHGNDARRMPPRRVEEETR